MATAFFVAAEAGTSVAAHAPTHRPNTGTDPLSTAAAGTIAVGDAAAIGVGDSFSRNDHVHALPAPTAPANVTKAAAATGVATTVARSDHKHDVTTAAPATGVGGSNAEGTATSLARSDHDHTIRETGGPTNLTVGAIADGQNLKRVGTVIIGVDVDPARNDFRLTGQSAVPLMPTNTSFNTIYLTPYIGNRIALYNGTRWIQFASAEVSLAITGRTAGLPFDIFAYDVAGVVTLEFLDWASTVARATALVRQDGVWVKSGATTRRYLGTCIPFTDEDVTWTVTGSDTAGPVALNLWNVSNRLETTFSLIATTNSWTYTTATWRQALADVNTNLKVEVVQGLVESVIDLMLLASTSNTSSAIVPVQRSVGIGVDSTTVNSAINVTNSTPASNFVPLVATLKQIPSIGYHFYAWLEISAATSTTTWYGDNGAAIIQSGMTGTWMC